MRADFERDGFVIVHSVFDATTAADVRSLIDTEVALGGDDVVRTPTMVHLQRMLHGGPLERVMSPKLARVLDGMFGRDHWSFDERYGWWPLLLAGHNAQADLGRLGWHVDGQESAMTVDPPHRAAIGLFMFSDVRPGHGGTALRVGSHTIIRAVLERAGSAGLPPRALVDHLDDTRDCEVVEATARAGDVVVMHPYLVHSVGIHRGSTMRVACNAVIRRRP